jgi:hypothetical protein
MTDIIVNQTLNKSGCSMNLSGNTPESGYMVSIPDCEKKVKLSNFNPSIVSSFIHRNKKYLSNSRTYIGTWINKDYVYLDVSINLMNLRVAKTFGISSNQIAIFDVNKFETITL